MPPQPKPPKQRKFSVTATVKTRQPEPEESKPTKQEIRQLLSDKFADDERFEVTVHTCENK